MDADFTIRNEVESLKPSYENRYSSDEDFKESLYGNLFNKNSFLGNNQQPLSNKPIMLKFLEQQNAWNWAYFALFVIFLIIFCSLFYLKK